ncbi:hypothetical protein FE257_005858 [Aspergillus nanangensis]|uniref:Uncharacterized protein n=1 Tax=Aspergillus nanangensis TaxID=2582783 RepID=A0AAD4CQB7_ASPNN|nr:hypothetical protein FE257_005858 [Aspergillus nanangensis]
MPTSVNSEAALKKRLPDLRVEPLKTKNTAIRKSKTTGVPLEEQSKRVDTEHSRIVYKGRSYVMFGGSAFEVYA